MIEYIDEHTPYSIILEYFEPMALTNKMELLKAIINKSDGYFHRVPEEEKENESFSQLLAALLKHFSRELLTMTVVQAMKQKYYYSPNRFVRYLLFCFNISNLRAV